MNVRPRSNSGLRLIVWVVCAMVTWPVLGEDKPVEQGKDATAAATSPSTSGTTNKSAQYLRVRRDAQQEPLALETAISRFVPKQAAATPGTPRPAVEYVDLIGAVHVGEPAYYDQLNELFKTYDVVLYELVAPEGTRVTPGQARAGNPLSFLQNVMKDVLNLEFQLDGVDYSPANLVHADMSPEEFQKSMADRGESFVSMFFRMMLDSMSVQAKKNGQGAASEVELLVALIAKDRAYRMKRILAEQFESMEDQMTSLNGPEGSTLITERNKKALSVLKREMEGGKRRIAIFYGAGHLSDMASRLDTEFGLRADSERWLAAWTIERPAAQAAPSTDSPTANPPAAKDTTKQDAVKQDTIKEDTIKLDTAPKRD